MLKKALKVQRNLYGENGETIEKDWTDKNGNGGRVERGLLLHGNALYVGKKK